MHKYIILFTSFKISLIAIILFNSQLSAQEKSRENPRLAIHAGIGSLFAGAGVMIEYQIPIVKKVKLDPFITIGSQKIDTEIPGIWLGYAGGVNIEFGKIVFDRGPELNWLFGINYGSQGVGFDSVTSDSIDPSNFKWMHQHLLTGFACIAGYKFNRNGFTWQVNMGLCYVHNPIATNAGYFYKPTGGLGIGYKF
jgi:hypothetical protein